MNATQKITKKAVGDFLARSAILAGLLFWVMLRATPTHAADSISAEMESTPTYVDTQTPIDNTNSGSYSRNVSVAVEPETLNCAMGQKFKITITVTTEEVYTEGTHKYIGYLAYNNGGWREIKSWYIDGGIMQYTITVDSDSEGFADTDLNQFYIFAASVFPVDNFTQGASLVDKYFSVCFLKSSFTLTYDANGGTCDRTTGSIIYNCPYGELPTPTRTGYDFQGWYTGKDGETKITADTLVTATGNQTIYAGWKAKNYTAILDANGGSCTPLSIPVTYHSPYESLGHTSVTAPQGYEFEGWYTSASGGTKVTADTLVSIAADHTLYAHWKKSSSDNSGTSGSSGSNGNSGGSGNNGNSGSSDNSGSSGESQTQPQTITVSSKTVAYKSKPFSLKAKASGGGKLTYKSSNKKVATVSSTGKVTVKRYGKATITVRAAAKENYLAAEKKITVKVVPKTPALKKVSSPGKKGISASWSKDKTVDGYQMYLCLRKDFKKGAYERTYKKTASSMKLTGLKSRKNYYLKLRSYKKVGKTKYYSKWSKVKKMKVK